MITDDTLKRIEKFREDRDWKQFHTIKDLCLGLGIEVAELQEIFLWKTEEQIKSIKASPNNVREELADIFIFMAYISKELNIDLDRAVNDKITLNEKKYPISKSKGNNKKYSEL